MFALVSTPLFSHLNTVIRGQKRTFTPMVALLLLVLTGCQTTVIPHGWNNHQPIANNVQNTASHAIPIDRNYDRKLDERKPVLRDNPPRIMAANPVPQPLPTSNIHQQPIGMGNPYDVNNNVPVYGNNQVEQPNYEPEPAKKYQPRFIAAAPAKVPPPARNSWQQRPSRSQTWSMQSQKVHIGVILPLHGKYGSYGRTLLDGIRMAVNEAGKPKEKIALSIMDSAAGPDSALKAYQQLTQGGANWIIGPLIKKNVNALLPHLRPDIPVISPAKHVELAERHPALFIHSISRNAQAVFMANYAYKQGIKYMAVISGNSSSESSEARAFITAFKAIGGSFSSNLSISNNKVNFIDQLKKIPPTTEAIYLALPGKTIVKLAGQLAYVELMRVPLYGSNRWVDGHLLSDRGRHLNQGRFCRPIDPAKNAKFSALYQKIWGSGKPGMLFSLGYDSAKIALSIGDKSKKQGAAAIKALHSTQGFSAKGGHVTFNEEGVGEKSFQRYGIQKGKVIRAK